MVTGPSQGRLTHGRKACARTHRRPSVTSHTCRPARTRMPACTLHTRDMHNGHPHRSRASLRLRLLFRALARARARLGTRGAFCTRVYAYCTAPHSPMGAVPRQVAEANRSCFLLASALALRRSLRRSLRRASTLASTLDRRWLPLWHLGRGPPWSTRCLIDACALSDASGFEIAPRAHSAPAVSLPHCYRTHARVDQDGDIPAQKTGVRVLGLVSVRGPPIVSN